MSDVPRAEPHGLEYRGQHDDASDHSESPYVLLLALLWLIGTSVVAGLFVAAVVGFRWVWGG